MGRAQTNQALGLRQSIMWASFGAISSTFGRALPLRGAIVAIVLCLPWVAGAEPTVIDRSVALVNGQVMTLSELDFEARVLLIYAGGTEAATAPLDLPVL